MAIQPREIAPNILVRVKSAVIQDARDGWEGKPYAGKMVTRDRGQSWFTGEELGTETVPASESRYNAWLLGKDIRERWDAGHKMIWPDGRVFAISSPRSGCDCGCTMCLRQSRGETL